MDKTLRANKALGHAIIEDHVRSYAGLLDGHTKSIDLVQLLQSLASSTTAVKVTSSSDEEVETRCSLTMTKYPTFESGLQGFSAALIEVSKAFPKHHLIDTVDRGVVDEYQKTGWANSMEGLKSTINARVCASGDRARAGEAWATFIRAAGTHYAWLQVTANPVGAVELALTPIDNFMVPFDVQVGAVEAALYEFHLAEKLLQLERTLQLFSAREIRGAADGPTTNHGVFDPRKTLCVVFVSGDQISTDARIVELRNTILAELKRTDKDLRYKDVLLTKANILLVFLPARELLDPTVRLKKTLEHSQESARLIAVRLSALEKQRNEVRRLRERHERRETFAYVLLCALTVVAAAWHRTSASAARRKADEDMLENLRSEANARLEAEFAKIDERIDAAIAETDRTINAAFIKIHHTIDVATENVNALKRALNHSN